MATRYFVVGESTHLYVEKVVMKKSQVGKSGRRELVGGSLLI
jgi:hypothetical protein